MATAPGPIGRPGALLAVKAPDARVAPSDILGAFMATAAIKPMTAMETSPIKTRAVKIRDSTLAISTTPHCDKPYLEGFESVWARSME